MMQLMNDTLIILQDLTLDIIEILLLNTHVEELFIQQLQYVYPMSTTLHP